MNPHTYDSLADTYYRPVSELGDVRERSSLGHTSPDAPLFTLPMHIALLDSNGIIVAANEDWQRLAHGKDTFGLAVGSVGMDYLAVCRQAFSSRNADPGEIETSIRAVLDGARLLYSTEYPHNAPTGQRWFLLQVSQLPGPQPGAVVVHVDITERKLTEGEWVGALVREQIKRSELERSRSEPESAPPAAATPSAEPAERVEALQTILESMADGVAVFDRTGRITQTNRAFSEQFALAHLPGFETRLPIDGSQTIQVLDAADTLVSLEQLPVSRALHGEVVRGPDTDIRIHAADGRELDLTSNATPLRGREGHIVGAVVVTRDISWRKRLEREREEAHDSELALKETAQRLDEFLATAAHDLRSPLAVTMTAIDLAISRIERLASAVAIENLHLAQKLGPMRSCLDEARLSVDQLSRMVSVLFDTAQLRVGALKLHRRACQLVGVVREQVDALRKANPTRDIRFEAPRDRSVRVVADADRIMQVVTNYLTNALKYSPEDQPIEVRVAAEGTLARVSVRDHGPGLPPNEQEHIWERFYRVRSVQPSSRRNTGMGLGLHISKTIIELHGGQVGVESAVGVGSTFWFTLPIRPLKA